ncbi:hypothetical protein [Verrucomicrobium sp. BvORR034]|uniref:hypothetical protein n=1 Tax=Verrucomicrobium sp. BvORR034 TaxID=1396418 RepID=UPI00067933FD|nr:hypothetical protein [Verrucomicrobium sp. BvORR034]
MSDFDDAFDQAAEDGNEEMGEKLTINGVPDVLGTVSDRGFSTALSQTIGGKTELPDFDVYLSLSAVRQCNPEKGHKVLRQKKGIVGRVMLVQDLGGAGVMLTCGPVQTRDV